MLSWLKPTAIGLDVAEHFPYFLKLLTLAALGRGLRFWAHVWSTLPALLVPTREPSII